jgi:hypothetical protein
MRAAEIYTASMNLSGRWSLIVRVGAIIGLLIMVALATQPAIGWFKP